MKPTAVRCPYLRGVNTNVDTGPIGLFTLNPFNVNNPLLSVALDNFANLLALVVTPDNLEKDRQR